MNSNPLRLFSVSFPQAFLEDMARFKLVDRAAAGPHPSALELRAHADCRALHGLLLDLDWENPMNPRRGPGYGIWTRLSTAAYTVGRASRCECRHRPTVE